MSWRNEKNIIYDNGRGHIAAGYIFLTYCESYIPIWFIMYKIFGIIDAFLKLLKFLLMAYVIAKHK